ncbi:MAG: site-specific integrase [Chromatiales bacterium]|nr:site-specific integrase [Chromatiales bacterium]
MATILKLARKNGTSKYRALIRRQGHPVASRVFRTKKEADEWVRKIEGDLDQLDDLPGVEARRRTLAQAIEGYMLEYQGQDSARVGRLAWWKDNYGDRRLSTINQATIKEALKKLGKSRTRKAAGAGEADSEDKVAQGRSAATLNRHQAAIAVVLKWAIEERWITKNPALQISRQKEPGGRVRFLSEEERNRLLAACAASEWPDLLLFVKIALSTGARLGEIQGLRWSDLDLKKGLAHLRTSKSGEPRMLPLIDPIRDALDAKPRPIDRGLIFRSPHAADRPFNFRPHWERAVTAAELGNFRFHDLRHSCASYLAMNGASLLEIADVLGHKTLAMVKRYSHLSTAHKQNLVARTFKGMVE